MRSKTLTCTLAAVAVTLAVALTSVRLQRPEPEPISATAPVCSSSTPSSADPLTTAAAAPTTQVIDPAADGGPDPLPSSEVQHRSDAGDGATHHRRQGRRTVAEDPCALRARTGPRAGQLPDPRRHQLAHLRLRPLGRLSGSRSSRSPGRGRSSRPAPPAPGPRRTMQQQASGLDPVGKPLSSLRTSLTDVSGDR